MTFPAFVHAEMGGSSGLPLLAAFRVDGVPEPKGSMTAIVRGGRAILIPAYDTKRKDGTRSDSRKRHEQWVRSVTAAGVVYQAVNRRHVRDDEALVVELKFFLPRPPSLPPRVHYPIRKKDADKLARLVLDCLTKSGTIADDGRIVDLVVRKRFAIGCPPGVEIVIRDAAGVAQGALL
jgi:Holliday junction resolvase RusA-like endonuclease